METNYTEPHTEGIRWISHKILYDSLWNSDETVSIHYWKIIRIVPLLFWQRNKVEQETGCGDKSLIIYLRDPSYLRLVDHHS